MFPKWNETEATHCSSRKHNNSHNNQKVACCFSHWSECDSGVAASGSRRRGFRADIKACESWLLQTPRMFAHTEVENQHHWKDSDRRVSALMDPLTQWLSPNNQTVTALPWQVVQSKRNFLKCHQSKIVICSRFHWTAWSTLAVIQIEFNVVCKEWLLYFSSVIICNNNNNTFNQLIPK